ncbi:MAG TPA: NADH-quinone oxidoreductase subunit J [Ignavibacteriales bacterium]|nr:NADH-quinone oxidoreductase subunit J [Ignavibacteriales bacterium]
MSLELFLFIFFAAIAAVSAVMMITRPSPVMSALFLILNFFALAGLYLTLSAQFIAAVQIIVYAGAIMVLFLFVLMLLNAQNEPGFGRHLKQIKYFAIFIAGLVFAEIAYMIFSSTSNLRSATPNPNVGTIESVGQELYVNHLLPFEAAGFLLLAATIGALVIAKKKFE